MVLVRTAGVGRGLRMSLVDLSAELWRCESPSVPWESCQQGGFPGDFAKGVYHSGSDQVERRLLHTLPQTS